MKSRKIFIITGETKVGKTLLVKNVIDELRKNKIRVSGVYSPARFINEKKTGIYVEDISNNKRKLLAIYKPGWDHQNLKREWKMDTEAIHWGKRIIQNSIPTSVLIIDELGFMEFEKNKGWTSAFKVLEGNDYCFAIVVVRTDFLENAKTLWKDAGVLFIENPQQCKSYTDHIVNQILDANCN